MMEKTYIGDGVSVAHDGYQLILTTSNGITTTNTIALEPEVWSNLLRYDLARAARQAAPPSGATPEGSK
jgi:hypothetical protein